MEQAELSFDGLAHEVEAHLRELRRLLAATVILSDAQNEALKSLQESLYKIHLSAIDLRHSLLTGEDPVPQPVPQGIEKLTQAAIQTSRDLQMLLERLKMEAVGLPRSGQSQIERIAEGESLSGPPRSDTPKPPRDYDEPDDDFGGAPVLVGVGGPRRPREGGAARTFAEAEEPPRNP